MKCFLNNKMSIIVIMTITIASVSALFVGCTASQKITTKSGAQLWAENCQRCHNTPSPSTFSHDQWVTIGMHMQSRALLTDAEREKIVAFLKQ